MTFTFGSLFAGIGGFDLGLERAGMECRWQVEIDDYATKVLEKHWPDVKRYRDIRSVGAGDLEPVDLICGGFPCQDISKANQNAAGINGERSGLYRELIRIVCMVRPRFILMENVAALLSRDNGMGEVLGDLAESGYDAEWQILSAAAFGAPHIRRRVFILCYPHGHHEPVMSLDDEASGLQGISADTNGSGLEGNVCKELETEDEGRHYPYIARSTWWDGEPGLGRLANGIPNQVDRLKCLGNAVVPQIAEWIGRRILETQT